jgi:type II secretory pathway component PulC
MAAVPRWALTGVSFAVACWLAANTANEAVAATLPEPSSEQSAARLPVMLIGTFAVNEPSLSRATLYDRESKQTLVVAIGDQIEDQALVMRIEQGRVVLRENGALRELTLDDADQGASRATPPSQLSHLTSARTEEPVRRLDEHEIFNQLLGQGQVLPKFEDGGQMVGLQINAIQAGSLFEEIGLEDGDVITAFNGDPVD